MRFDASVLQLLREINPRYAEFSKYPDYFNLRAAEFLLLRSRLSRCGDVCKGRVLEVGCGTGFSLLLWSRLVQAVVGVDLPSAVSSARKLLAAFPPPEANVEIVESAGESLINVSGTFDLIYTQYVLEHVRNIEATLQQLRVRTATGGRHVHVLPNLCDRDDWYITYRKERNLGKRIVDSIRGRGIAATVRNPFGFTPPHDAGFGTYEHERQGYRLEQWALRFLKAGYVIEDYFQTRDVNWVFVTSLPPG